MLASFRTLAGTWPARILFIVLGASFMSWGVADVVSRVASGGTDVATVDGRAITPAEFQQDYQQGLRRMTERFPDPSQMPPEVKQTVARQTLERLVTQAALGAEVERLHLAVPDEALRQAVFAVPSFQGPGGKFQRATFLQVLASNSLTEAHFLDLMRADIAQNQLIQTIGASAAPSGLLTGMIHAYLNETRTADLLMLGFASRPVPPSPAEPVLQRFYDNNPSRYSAPEYRHIKAVVLSPATIGRGLDVTEADQRAWFDQHKSEFITTEKRSLQVITTGSKATAQALAATWRGGASWEAMQAAAKAAGASTAALDDATVEQVPSPELAKAAFAAQPNTIAGPIEEPLGVQIARVTKVAPARSPNFESLKPVIRDRVAAEKATDLVDVRARKLQDLFAGGAKIDEVPAELGAAGAAGTLDAKGDTKEGAPAPVPAAGALRTQIIEAAFKANVGDPIQPAEGPDHAWYAVAVDAVEKPTRLPFAQVRARVLADWRTEQVRHQQETEATRILGLVRGGQTLSAAAWGSGLQVTRTQPIARGRPSAGVPAELASALFTLKPGQATMAETGSGFAIASLAQIIKPDAKADAAGLARTHDGLVQALREDTMGIYANALKDRAKPVINQRVFAGILQQPGE